MSTSFARTEPFTFSGIGDGGLRSAFTAAGHSFVDLVRVNPVHHDSSRRERMLRAMAARRARRSAGMSATNTSETLATRPTVFVLGQQTPGLSSLLTNPAESLAARMLAGDLFLIERTCRPGDCARIVETIRTERPDLCTGERELLVDVAFCPPPPTPASGQPEVDRLIGGYTPQASQRAKEVLQVIHDGPLFTADAVTVEHLTSTPHTDERSLALSVIMPAFNVRKYIEDSVESVLSQNLGNLGDLELIVVDDGSDDGTLDVLEALAQEDHRLTIVRAEHSGPGVARNRGLRLSHGRYLAFADADDRVLPGAYAALVGALERSGSEVATGTYVRTGTTGRVRPRLSERVHARNRTFHTIAESPNLLEEPVLWNKAFSRGLWQRAVHAIPDVLNYEDQEPVFRALLNAKGIDVLTRDVYEWRLPDGRETRSRGQYRRRNLRARGTVIETLEVLLHDQPENVRAHAYAAWVGRDLMMHAEKVPAARKRFFRYLSRITRGLVRRMPASTWSLITAQERFLAHAVASGELKDVEEILGTRAEETTSVPLESRYGDWWCHPTYLSRLTNPVPEDLTRAQPVDFTVQGALRAIEWTASDHLTIVGYAYIPGVDPATCEVELIGLIGSHEVLSAPTRRVRDEIAAQDSNDPWHDVAPAGFTASIQLPDVRPGQRISVRARVTAPGATVDGRLNMHHSSAPAPIELHEADSSSHQAVGHEYRWVLKQNTRKHARFEAAPRTADGPVITDAGIGSGTVWLRTPSHLQGTIIAKGNGEELEFRQASSGPDGALFSAPLPQIPDELRRRGERFIPIFHRQKGRPDLPVVASTALCTQHATTSVCFSPDAYGTARLAQRATRVSVTSVAPNQDGSTFVVIGRIDPPDSSLQITLQSSSQTLAGDTHVNDDGSFRTAIPLVGPGPEGAPVSVPAGGHFLRYRTTTETAGWVRTTAAITHCTQVEDTAWNTLRFEERPGNLLAVTISAPLNATERSRYGQFQLRNRSWGPPADGIVFESFNGKGSAGNSRAILDAIVATFPHVPCWWSIRDCATEVPPGARPLVIGTQQWHSIMATAHVWVNDNNFPYYIHKTQNQYYIQTWHGTPLKKLLWDLPRRKVPLTYRRLMRNEVPQWDLLLAQTDEAAKHLRSGLGHKGDVLIGPYPRNDRLNAEQRAINAIRARANIIRDKPVVLYAPTWRNEHRGGRPVAWNQHIDLAKVAEAIDCQFLVRAHHMTSTRRLHEDRVIDVSDEPHVEYLMRLSNVLITDYSSLLFDYIRTGNPIIRHIPDAKMYDQERGVYRLHEKTADYTTTNQTELVDALKHAIPAEKHNRRELASTETTTKLAVETILKHLPTEYARTQSLDTNNVSPSSHE